jgi:AcrR family transcriptional regulator
MSYIAERRGEEKERRRAEILDAAELLYANKGWDAVTVEQVARSARLSRPLVYVYFRDKEDLLFAIGMVVQAIELGIQDGSIRPNVGAPVLLAMTLWAFTHGIIQLAMAKGEDLSRHGITIPHFSDNAFDLLRYMAQSKGNG